MKKIILSTICASALSLSLNADFIGAEAGYAMWKPSLSGTIEGENIGDTNIDLKDDLGYGSKDNNSFMWVYIDHPIPLLPNIKIQQTNYTSEASKSTNITFLGLTYNATTESEFTLNQTDVILYWRLLDNWINFDFGIDIRNVKGNVKLTSPGLTPTDKDFSVAIPLVYAKARFDLPFSGLSIETDLSAITYSGNKLYDTKAAIVYESSYGLGATAGIRSETIVLDDVNDMSADIKISGMYAGLFYHF